LPWQGKLARDDKFANLEGDSVAAGAESCLEHLDDLAVLVLFSFFESELRERVLSEIKSERAKLFHEHIMKIVDDALEGIENGSFYRILEIYKRQDADLVEQVNQVRRYRNWVAHGKRSNRPATVDPRMAFERLRRFLDRFERGGEQPPQ
jgi:hypothetical protein